MPAAFRMFVDLMQRGGTVLAIPSLKKVLIVAALGAALFLASFTVAGKMKADSYWYYWSSESSQYSAGSQYAGASQYGAGDVMVASYYGYELAGSLTASGEPFDPEGYTAAHKTMPLGTELQVSYGGNSVNVTVNDRGPYVAGRDLDLSQGAAETIGLTAAGSAPVEVNVLN
jgi:rare lipoprotein A (peptidoglycan hydrolase)